jgi:probable F420-dependent oxidoreductase
MVMPSNEENDMRFMAEYPILSDEDGGAWIDPANIASFARTMEAAGFDAIAFTDHPAPSGKWLRGGGHETFDPFVALGYLAGVTARIRLMTHLVVVPYRNPFIQAKSMTSLDVLSGGRATFVLGTGYLRSEFAALGVDMEERNDLLDEAVEVITGVWTNEEFSYEGRHFSAHGQSQRPAPVQTPHPPLWMGGNSKVNLRRIAKWGQGWGAMIGSPELVKTTRTAGIYSIEDLAKSIDYLGQQLIENGRTLSDVDIAATLPSLRLGDPFSPQARIDDIGKAAEAGCTWVGATMPHGPIAAALEAVEQFGAEVIAKTR